MQNPLNRLEARLQQLIEEGTARIFAGQDMKSLLIQRLADSMHAQVAFDDQGKLIAPHIYTIEVNPMHAADLKANQGLLDALKAALQAAAQEREIGFSDEPVIHIAPAEDVAEGDFRVRSAGLGEAIADTQSLRLAPAAQGHQAPNGAFLIVNGADIFTLDQPIINIGRKSDNQLVIDDAHVSRRHAQLRAIDGHYHFFDLGSTAGSTINGQTVKSAILVPGDVILLASVPLIYGQDSAPADETQEVRAKPAPSSASTSAGTKPGAKQKPAP
jgi:hypothetical protein